MAGWGHGRFYQSNSVQDIPQIFLKETREALKPWIVEGDIVPRLGSLAEILPGVPLGSFPHLTGYVATTPRAAADIVLKSATGDPLLATWQYGLGRVVAWTSDAEGRWSAGLLRWPNANLFFGDLVRSSLPPPGDPSLQVETLTRGDHTHLLVTAPAVSGSTVTVNAVAPDLGEKEVPLAPTGAGRFEGDLETSQVGSYLLHVTQAGAGGVTHATTTGLVVPYSPEYRDLGTDQATMAAVARAGGGKVLTDLAEAFQLPVPPVQATAGGPDNSLVMLLPPGFASLLDFVIWLLILAIFVRVILSYFPGMSYSQVGHYLGLATDWLLIPIGRVVPPLGGIDFSPFIAILLLYALRTLIQTSDLVAALLTIVASVLLMLIILLFIRVFFGFFLMDTWHPMVQIVTRT